MKYLRIDKSRRKLKFGEILDDFLAFVRNPLAGCFTTFKFHWFIKRLKESNHFQMNKFASD